MLGFSLPFYKSPTLLLSLGLSVRVLWHLLRNRPDVIHVSSPGLLVFATILYAKMLAIPLVVSYHTHIPEYIPQVRLASLQCACCLGCMALLGKHQIKSASNKVLTPADGATVHLAGPGGANVAAHPLLHAHGRPHSRALQSHEGAHV